MCPIVSFGGLKAPQMMIIGPWVLASQVNHMSTNLNYCKPQLNLTWTAIFSRIYLNQTLSYQFCAKRRTKKMSLRPPDCPIGSKGPSRQRIPKYLPSYVDCQWNVDIWVICGIKRKICPYIYIIQNRKCVQPIPIKWLIIPSFPMIVDEINRG